MVYNAEKKNLTPLYVGENIRNSRGMGKSSYTNYKITHTPNKSQMVNPLESKWKEGVQKNFQFSFCRQTNVFRYEMSFEEFNVVSVTAEPLACFEPGR